MLLSVCVSACRAKHLSNPGSSIVVIDDFLSNQEVASNADVVGYTEGWMLHQVVSATQLCSRALRQGLRCTSTRNLSADFEVNKYSYNNSLPTKPPGTKEHQALGGSYHRQRAYILGRLTYSLVRLQLKSDDRDARGREEDPLAAEIQDFIDGVANNYSIGVGVGYVDAYGRELGMGAGTIGRGGTVVLGSGTKPYVAAAVMRLVERGAVVLGDKAFRHADGPLRRMWNTSWGAESTEAGWGADAIHVPGATVRVDLPGVLVHLQGERGWGG